MVAGLLIAATVGFGFYTLPLIDQAVAGNSPVYGPGWKFPPFVAQGVAGKPGLFLLGRTVYRCPFQPGVRVSGIKCHIAVDTEGLPHAVRVTTANVTDRAGALAMFDQHRDGLSQVQKVLVDGGYTGKPFAAAVQSRLGATVEAVKRNELHTFVVLPKRWVVERSFAWLEKCRRLWKNCEGKLNTSLQMVVLAFAVLILKRS